MQLSTFLTYVKNDFKRTDKDTELTQFYNDSILAVAIKMPHNGYKYRSFAPLVAEQYGYTLPTGVVHFLHPVRYLEGSGSSDRGWQLNHITKREYDERYINIDRTDPSTSQPVDYTIFAGCIMIGPMISDTEVANGALLEIDWTKQPTDLVADSDIPDLEDTWREVLKLMTLARAYESIGMTEEGRYWRSRYEDERGDPIGIYKDLLSLERDKEGNPIGIVKNNPL
jgi:hypothetical protein